MVHKEENSAEKLTGWTKQHQLNVESNKVHSLKYHCGGSDY